MAQDPFRARPKGSALDVPRETPVAPPEPPEAASGTENPFAVVETVEAPTAVELLDISWPVARLVKWADKDPEKASQVLRAEQVRADQAGEQRRETLWLRLEKVAGG